MHHCLLIRQRVDHRLVLTLFAFAVLVFALQYSSKGLRSTDPAFQGCLSKRARDIASAGCNIGSCVHKDTSTLHILPYKVAGTVLTAFP